MLTTLVLQMSLYFSGIYLGFFGIAELAIQIYKWTTLPYPSVILVSELALWLMLIAVESMRIKLGKHGNLTNKTTLLLASALLIVPSLFAVLYGYVIISMLIVTFQFQFFSFS